MATGTNAIALESEVKSKTGSTGSITTNLCCTKARAIALSADSSYLTSYSDNQLVKYSDIYKKGGTTPTPQTIYYRFSVTFFFTSNKICTEGQDGRVNEGVGFFGSNGYVTLDSDESKHNSYTYTARLKSNNQIQLISTSHSAWPETFERMGGTFTKDYAYSTTKTLSVYDVLDSVYYADRGFNVNGAIKPTSDYVYYLAEDPWNGYKEANFSNYTYYKKDYNVNITGSSSPQHPNIYHIWIFENIYLKNQLLGPDASSYE